MLYITGDCHGNFERFNKSIFPEQNGMTKDDYVVICGDFGAVWNIDLESNQETMILDWLDCKPFTTLFVDGNHENFDRLYAYTEEKWKGGAVHKIRPSVLHLMRGQIFTIDGRTIFSFGGASSHDISGGILEPDDPDFQEKKKALDGGWRPYRINHVSWWEAELPAEKEMNEGWSNLERTEYNVDYIVTHCCSSSTQAMLSHGQYKVDSLTLYLEEIKQKVHFKKWFFGHYHDNRNLSAEETLIYEQIIRVW